MAETSQQTLKKYRDQQDARIDYYPGVGVYQLIQHYQQKHGFKAGECIDYLIANGHRVISGKNAAVTP